jgi:hypothetical protein
VQPVEVGTELAQIVFHLTENPEGRTVTPSLSPVRGRQNGFETPRLENFLGSGRSQFVDARRFRCHAEGQSASGSAAPCHQLIGDLPSGRDILELWELLRVVAKFINSLRRLESAPPQWTFFPFGPKVRLPLIRSRSFLNRRGRNVQKVKLQVG